MAKAKADQLAIWQAQNELLLSAGIDVVNRSFCINKDIDKHTFAEVDAKLSFFEREPKQPVTIKINSCGGSVYDAWAVCSRILNSKCVVNIEAHGAIMSAATMIFACGKLRSASKYCTFMFHQSSSIMNGKLSDIKNEVHALEAEEDMYVKFLSERSKKSVAFWKKIIATNKDVYVSADKVLKTGLFERIF